MAATLTSVVANWSVANKCYVNKSCNIIEARGCKSEFE